jgi:hypothetical protein
MRTIAIVVLIACIGAIAGGWFAPKARAGVLAASFVLVFALAWAVWWGVLFFQIVSLDSILAMLNIQRLGPLSRACVFLGPPLLAAVAFVAALGVRGRGWWR